MNPNGQRKRWYESDKQKDAVSLGFSSFDHAIVCLYSEKSLHQIGMLFEMTSEGIRKNLLRLGVKMKPRGGSNNVKNA